MKAIASDIYDVTIAASNYLQWQFLTDEALEKKFKEALPYHMPIINLCRAGIDYDSLINFIARQAEDALENNDKVMVEYIQKAVNEHRLNDKDRELFLSPYLIEPELIQFEEIPLQDIPEGLPQEELDVIIAANDEIATKNKAEFERIKDHNLKQIEIAQERTEKECTFWRESVDLREMRSLYHSFRSAV